MTISLIREATRSEIMEMLAQLEAQTGLSVPDTALFEATTIRQLAAKLSHGGAALAPKRLVKLNSEGARRPLNKIPWNFNAFARNAITLARLLGSDQPLYVVVPHGSSGEPILGSIEAMAKDRLSLITGAQPSGRYRLAGKCLGGIVAFEVARLLVASGEKVEFVLIIDAPTINARRPIRFLFSAMKSMRPLNVSFVEYAMAWTWYRSAQVQRFYNYPWKRRWLAIQRRLTAFTDRFALRQQSQDTQPATYSGWNSSPEDGIGEFTDARTSQYAAAMANYAPASLLLLLSTSK